MFGFGPSVQLTELGPRDGVLSGECGGFRWEARLARGPVSYGLDPETLYKGPGRIARLVLYDTARKVAAFDRGWQFGRRQHLRTIERIVRYLEQ